MDPVTLIISALSAGAVAALQDTASTAIKDSYQGLVTLIKKKFNKDPKAIAILDGHAEDPETWQKPLEKSIHETGVDVDEKILLMAQKMLELVQSQSSSPKYDVSIQGDVQGYVQGDNTKVTMNFGMSHQKRKTRKSTKKP